MRILFIRHAEPDYKTDTLTPKGRREAELLSRRMANYKIRDAYVSPLGRARETAEYCLKPLGREAEVLDWLAEFRGRFPDPKTGKPALPWDFPPRLWSAIPGLRDAEHWADDPFYAGGSVREIWDETTQGMDALMARYGFVKDGPVWLGKENRRETIAIFCHFAISMAALAYLINESPVPLWQRCLCLTSSVSEVVTEERVSGEVSFRVTRLGDISHLEIGGEPRSTAGLFPECYTGTDSTDQNINGEGPWGPYNPY